MISISADNEWPTRCLRCFSFFSLSLFLFAIFRSFDSLLSSFSVNLGQFRIPISFLSFFRRSIFESFWKKVVRISKIVEIFFPPRYQEEEERAMQGDKRGIGAQL